MVDITRNVPLTGLRYMIRYTVPHIHDIDECFAVVDLIKWRATTHQHEKDDPKTPNVYSNKKPSISYMIWEYRDCPLIKLNKQVLKIISSVYCTVPTPKSLWILVDGMWINVFSCYHGEMGTSFRGLYTYVIWS